MTDEQDTTGMQPDSSHIEQVNQPTRPIDPQQPAPGAPGGTQWFVPGKKSLPASAFEDDTQASLPSTPSTPATASGTAPVGPVADHTGSAPAPSSPSAGPAPVVTRPMPLRTRPLLGRTAIQPPTPPTRVLPPGAPMPVPPGVTQRGRTGGTRDFTLFWLAGGLVLIILLSFAFVGISSSFLPHTEGTDEGTQPAVVSSTGVPIAGGFSVAPDHFNPAACAVDNGYRCTANLFYGKPGVVPLSWTAYGTNVATKFSPASGVLAPDQQQQVIIYMLTPCPNNGDFVFQINGTDTKLLVPWSC